MTDKEKLEKIKEIVMLCNTDCAKEVLKIIQGEETEKEILSESAMVTVEGECFHCPHCGANVFTHFTDDTFVCHGCDAEYEGVK